MDLNGNRFMLMVRLYNIFNNNKLYSREGFSSKLALCKALSGVDNPSPTIKVFVDKLVAINVLVYSRDGLLIIDRDAFMRFIEDSAEYVEVKKLVSDNTVLFW